MIKKRQKAMRAGFVPGSGMRIEVDAESLASTSDTGFRIKSLEVTIASMDKKRSTHNIALSLRVPKIALIGHIQVAIKEFLELEATPRIGMKKKNIEWLDESRKLEEVARQQLVYTCDE
jgi:hypothetical protein